MVFSTKGINSSNMVLLQNSTNCIFGTAPAGSKVNLKFGEITAECTADNKNEWKLEFNPGAAKQGQNLVLECEGESSSKIIFNNVAVGEVWICSGQSNMQLQMERLKYTYPDEFKKPENPYVRMITIPVTYAFDGPKDSINNPEWKMPSPETLSGMSGTAYFFANRLSQELGIPVGVITCCQGGTPITAWMNGESMHGIGDYEKRIKQLKTPGFIEKIKGEEKAAQDAWNEKINSFDAGSEGKGFENKNYEEAEKNWKTCELPGEVDLIENGGIVWFKKKINLTAEQVKLFNEKGARIWMGTIRDADKVWINGTQVGVTYYVYPPRRYDIPDGILKEGENIITLRVQQNLHNRKMYFWPEKHYAIASRDTKVIPVAIRNVERVEGIQPSDKPENNPAYIPLDGKWLCMATSQIEDAPAQVFLEYEPEALYNAMLSPCFNYAVRGALWYQGESNDQKAYEYKDLLCRMINLWREKFVFCPEEKMPFVVMQLPSWADDVLPETYPLQSNWAEIREAQKRAVSESENTALSVLIDGGEWNDLHPEKKLTGGTRSAERALTLVYGKPYPKLSAMEVVIPEKNMLRVLFDNGRLEAYEISNGIVDFNKPCKEAYGFAVVTKSLFGKKAVLEVPAVIAEEDEIRLNLPVLPPFTKVIEIRYLWANCPEYVNLYSEGLPVVPGRICL